MFLACHSDGRLDVVVVERADDGRAQAQRHGLQMVEREIIRACLQSTDGQLSPAAKMLGISRTTLRKKMTDLGIQARTSIEYED